ncbi:MAG TPA: tetratricopeptide repeat-containing sensor histidine kinase [Bacteroidales bacterium]|nr:tetratricopeptide repeat-containing sensor histidine kinase [Bacteroidales bacterium]
MVSRFITVTSIALLVAINSLFALQASVTDSLLHLIQNNLVKDETRRYDILCQIASNSADAEIILQYSDEAIKLAEKLGISPARPTVFKGIGYLNSGRLVLALESFLKAAGYYRADGSDIGLATVYMYISETYNMQENHDNEKYYLKNAIAIFTKEKDSINLASALHNLGYANYSMGQYDTALILFSKTSELYRKLGYLSEYAYCVGNSGLVYSKKSEFDKAGEHLLKAIEILDKQGDEYAVTEYMIEYARVLQHKGEIKEAVALVRKSFGNATRNSIIELQRDAAYRLAQLYRISGRYDSAFHYHELYMNFNDSVNNYESIQKMADLRTAFEVSEKQAEVDVLEKNKLIQLIVIGGLILILLLAGGLILLYYYSLKRLRKLTAALDERRIILEQQREELKELNRIKDKFFSVISHDLRGPISSIGGISYMIKESLENNNPALLNEITDYIDQTVFSLTGLLENLLNWAQNQQGKFPFVEEKIDVKETINEVVKIFSTITILKNIRISLKLKAKLFISGDRNSFMMIIRNLLSNAFKFTKAGGTVSISTGLTPGGGAEIVVSDNGIGIPAEKLPWLFEFRENKSTYGTEKEKGIGLGLNLIHEFVKLNKGTIEVKSTVGKGTNFMLRFPAVDHAT